MVLFFFLLSFSISDFCSATVAKPLVKRERPCNDVLKAESVVLRVYCGPGYSFPSSHATNHASMGLFLFLLFKKLFRKYAYAFLMWPVLVSFAQVYVGVHYPFDIFTGWILGTAIGTGMFKLLSFYFRYFY